jgi:hypothetical protein
MTPEVTDASSMAILHSMASARPGEHANSWHSSCPYASARNVTLTRKSVGLTNQ